jgi:hypothetical protein
MGRPDEAWMLQVGRNLTDWQAGALHAKPLHAKQYLIIDRDTKYWEQFRRLIRDHAPAVAGANDGAIYRHARRGGTFNFYYRQAA